MRLKSIKLSGFKSFVDATTVAFPSNMTAVVGPNGCGKSNIIDAVRWVLGESSAKYLRGESMTDVIFNGSSARKPVGQAAIELVFDNHNGSAPGEFAQYSEISVRRRVSRQSQSDYFLNGTKCRRRDITDLFLGTGLGPRSYAIIEQGMISRLIEAKPEELRIYIEEAAGISKYKERRRETENRIRRTQENLERLSDVRAELGRQLQHLEQQAVAAEKYKTFKQNERCKKAELTVLRWQHLNTELQSWHGRIRDTELQLEKHLTGRIRLDTELESLRTEHQQRNEQFNRTQARYYEAGADVARLEQSLQNSRDRSRQASLEVDQALASERELASELEQDNDKLAAFEEELAMLEPEQEELSLRAETSGEQLHNAEHAMADWQQRWDDFSARSADAHRQADLAQSSIRALDTAIEQLRLRDQRLQQERQTLQQQLDHETLGEQRELQARVSLKREGAQQIIEDSQQQLQQLRSQQQQAEQHQNQQRQQVQRLEATLESQQQLLAEQLGHNNGALQHWLDQHQLTQTPRLAAALDIDEGWEFATEQVLGRLSQSLVLPQLSAQLALLDDAPAGAALLSADAAPAELPGATSLAARVRGNAAIIDALANILVADSLQQAQQQQRQLQHGQSVITPQGVWMGRHWVLMPAADASQTGVIERQKTVLSLEAQLELAQRRLDLAETNSVDASQALERTEQKREQARRELTEADQHLGTIAAQLGALQARSEQITQRLNQIDADAAELELDREHQHQELECAREEWQQGLEATEEHDEHKEQLLAQRDGLREKLDQLRQQARHERDQAHQLQLTLQSLNSQRDGLRQTISRAHLQQQRVDERLELLRQSREQAEEPLEDLQLELEGLLERRLAEEGTLSEAREGLENLDRRVREADQGRSGTEQQIQQVRATLETLKMECQALEIRAGNHLEQLSELNITLRAVLEQLDDSANEQEWTEELEKIAGRIQRLGAINLAAIDEFQVQSERKTYLDSQHEDLTEALEILDGAIRKIDRETRQRFKETFDRVNEGLQGLFPKVFGGGHASLELTGEDLLETGVTIMARPPGKKNSTIHLLSGGEKALTAIALVFAIFKLNPAPFCMLDEVDAPLDDANVGRYVNLVKEMSKQVQFIYITHNKIAMEQADQLMGVTMHEPGCSRLVTVDVEAAAALAEA
ncbi:chromosome segregation protein SMC [Marinobacter sp. LV10MA510-1]|uniref:chromosome segregation protein SMC n=1 Tax=Marinobacter sp. LV10MA510-1 TaxID=1415567 RepID=UPI000BF2FDB9|nr:chromosome segregation protein SMC [Marinobacter sp. LV10MA510-1]PFG08425.1 condensin subunit Smc [Marinobacter sp. LV10MA510-1]